MSSLQRTTSFTDDIPEDMSDDIPNNTPFSNTTDEIDVGEQAKGDEEEENPNDSQILEVDTAGLDFNLDEASPLPSITEEDESSSSSEPEVEAKIENEIESDVDKLAKQAAKEATNLVVEVERLDKRVRKPSPIIKEIQETKEQIDYEKANPVPKKPKSTPKKQVVDGYASDFHQSVATAATEIIQKDIRLESYSATSQAKKIYGSNFSTLTSPDQKCALCACMFKDRISYSHNRNFHPDNLEKLTITYDHFTPVNFSALVFRIPVAGVNYDNFEMNIFLLNGHMTCYHCNYEKSQRMFITCPKKGGVVDFNNFAPNEKSIKAFFTNLVKSENKHGFAKDGITKTLDICLKGKDKNQWIEERVKEIKSRANLVCEEIKRSVELENVKRRIQMTKILIRKAIRDLSEDSNFSNLSKKGQYRYKREYISRLFGQLELDFPKPWKSSPVSVPIPDMQIDNTPSSKTPEIRKTSPFDRTKVKNIDTSERQKDPSITSIQRSTTARNKEIMKKRGLEPRVLQSGDVVVPTRIKSPFEKQRESDRRLSGIGGSRKRKNKRKTYRRIRLF
jgi:hypothetical protein